MQTPGHTFAAHEYNEPTASAPTTPQIIGFGLPSLTQIQLPAIYPLYSS